MRRCVRDHGKIVTCILVLQGKHKLAINPFLRGPAHNPHPLPAAQSDCTPDSIAAARAAARAHCTGARRCRKLHQPRQGFWQG